MQKHRHSVTGHHHAGFSLVEIMIAMVIFTMLALGITGTVIQSQRIAQNNILSNTAYTVVQGYLEQLKTISSGEIEAALLAPATVPLRTRSISALGSGNETQVDDFLYLNGFNAKEILIDLQEKPNVPPREIVMHLWVDLNIEPSPPGTGRYYRITIDFDYEVRGMRRPPTREALCWVRTGLGQYQQETRSLSGSGRLHSLRLTQSAVNES